MNNTLLNIGLSSLVVTAAYNKLYQMSYMNQEDSEEYKEEITKLKKYIQVENEYYHELTDNDIATYFQLIANKTKFDNVADARIYSRMNEIKKQKENSPAIAPLSMTIASKVLIDVLKIVNKRINAIEANDDIDDTDITMLEIHTKRFNYHYLSANSFIEQMALECNFDINEIPTIEYTDIEKQYNVSLVKHIQKEFSDYIIGSLNELANLKSDDKYIRIYLSIFEAARVEAMLPYLNLESLDKVLSYINTHSTKYDSNGALRKVRKLIIKRKEEFNK